MCIVCHDCDNLWFRLTEFDRPNQAITGWQYRVHLKNRTCDCRRIDALCYPCANVIAACQNLRLDPISYVDEMYKIEYMYNVWRHVFLPVPDERKWPFVSFAPFKLLQDRELRRKPKENLVIGVGRMTHIDRIMNAEVFVSPIAEVFESNKVMEIGKKKSSPTAPRAIPHATTAYISSVDSE
ncbi:hypothetical protein J1N35_003389 [Gossypium stocksii]|uniref:SWIM-type domain-containing protein n=1 Tax=Gossypium stocksii TaxID=47602 RepID=A0A9D3WNV2_9ROSI|nr:hypothetical protein J1N35_003389 [Gossypium stocksii]